MWGSIAISDFLTKSESWVPVEPDGKYKQITARLWGKGLTLRGEVPGSAIAAARQYCAKAGQFLLSRIDARHDIAALRQHPVPQRSIASPSIRHRLPPRLAIDVEQHRIPFRRIETRRLDDRRVHRHALAEIDPRELGSGQRLFGDHVL